MLATTAAGSFTATKGKHEVVAVVFRERLQQLREKRRISRQILSELCGLHPDAIRRYERGECEPNLESLIAISDFFDVSVDYLIGRE